MADLSVIRPAADPDVVAALEEWLEDARAGRLHGVLMLGNPRGGEVSRRWAGDMPAPLCLLALELWKKDSL